MFWRGVLGYLPVNVIQAVAGFGAIVAFTRLLEPSSYGAYAVAFSVSALAHTLFLTWNEAAMARFYAAEAEGADREALFATVYRTFAVVGLVLPLLAAAVALFVPVSAELKWAVCAGLTAASARSLLKIAQERRRAAGDVRGFAGIDMAATGGGFALGVAFAWIGLGAAAPFVGAGLASALCLIAALPSELKVAARGRFDAGRLRRYAAYGLPLSLALILSLALSSTDRFVLAAYSGEAATGAYHAGYTLANRTLDVMFIWIGMAGGPAAIAAFERGGEQALRRVAEHQAGLLLVMTVPAATGLALVSRPLAEVMVGPALVEAAAGVTPWIAAGALFSGLTTYYLHTAFTLARRTRRQMLAVAIPALANLGLCFWLIPAYGLDGAKWATAASYGLGMVAAWALGRGCIALPIPWDALVRTLLAAAVMAAVVVRVPALGGFPELILKAGAGALAYGLAALALDPARLRTEAMVWLKARSAGAAP